MFQPAVDLASGRLLGFEALLRWANGRGGSVPPDVLIPWAEAKGQMTALNSWVLSVACAQAVRWPSSLQLAVNCAVFQLRRGEAAIAAASALEQSGLSPNRLIVEVTEASLADNEATADLHAIHRLGIQLAIDDVGLDRAIFDNVRDCVVNTMKIDGVVIGALTESEGPSRTIVEAIVGLSASLGICTVAEAVETADQATILRQLGVDIAQGYYFSPPMSAEDAYVLAATEPLPTLPITVPADAAPDQTRITVAQGATAAPADPVPDQTLPPVQTRPRAPAGAVPVQDPSHTQPKPPTAPVGAYPEQAPVPVMPRPAGAAPGAVPVQAPSPTQPKPLTAPVGAYPEQAPVPVQTRQLAAPAGAVPVQAPSPTQPKPLTAPVGAYPEQAPVPVQTRQLAAPAGAVPVQTPQPVHATPPVAGQVHFAGMDTESGIKVSTDAKIDELNQAIAQLTTVVQRLNELLEPWLMGSRRAADTHPAGPADRGDD
ncbi:MAG TPA: EAL domain-containing protein [Acidimicrobiales bacterium]|nr:EAL domain-containing protein [Acidimicrobiales bacterium]